MADSTTSPDATDPTSQPPGPDNPITQPTQPDPSPLPPPSSSSTPPTTVAADPNPNPNPNPNSTTPPPPLPQPPSIQPYLSAVPPSFRPAGPSVPLPTPPQFSPLPNSNFQAHNFHNPGVQPPGVNNVTIMMPPPASGVGSVTVSSVPPLMMSYVPPGQQPNPGMRAYAPMPNGYPTMPGHAPPPVS